MLASGRAWWGLGREQRLNPFQPSKHVPCCHLLLPPPQYCYLVFCVLLLLPLTLPIDGTDWGGQFEGWSAGSWAVLVLVSSVVCIGANFCIQVGGAPGLGGGGGRTGRGQGRGVEGCIALHA
jgi:hypothetical protein